MTRPDTTECESCGQLMPCCAPRNMIVPVTSDRPTGYELQRRCHRCRSVPDDACDDCHDYNAPPWWMAWWWLPLPVVALAALALKFMTGD